MASEAKSKENPLDFNLCIYVKVCKVWESFINDRCMAWSQIQGDLALSAASLIKARLSLCSQITFPSGASCQVLNRNPDFFYINQFKVSLYMLEIESIKYTV